MRFYIHFDWFQTIRSESIKYDDISDLHILLVQNPSWIEVHQASHFNLCIKRKQMLFFHFFHFGFDSFMTLFGLLFISVNSLLPIHCTQSKKFSFETKKKRRESV